MFPIIPRHFNLFINILHALISRFPEESDKYILLKGHQVLTYVIQLQTIAALHPIL